jgi:thioredoxin reductase
MKLATDITIIGAGPYGLSIAAYLRARGLDFRIVGSPMHTWRTAMPKGMLLKSVGFASTLYDPGRTFTLQRFCKDHGIPYQDVGLPVSLDTFCSYGVSFQKELVPELEDEKLVALNRAPDGFDLKMESGHAFGTRKVVLAVGIDYFRHLPQPLMHLPAWLCSHSSEHHDLRRFRHKEVAVVGGGASAIDIAVLLHEAQAKVHLIARAQQVRFGYKEEPVRPFMQRLRAPMSGVGPGWKNRICTEVPWLYRYLPDRLRLRSVKRFLGPAGGWFMKDRAVFMPRILGCELQEARACGSRVQLRLVAADGGEHQVSADHVIAATGYKPDVHRLPFLSLDVLDQLRLIGESPRLSAHFESSIPGLYFVGPISATSFGPVMRFAVGAEFVCQRISRHLARGARERSVPPKVEAVSRAH